MITTGHRTAGKHYCKFSSPLPGLALEIGKRRQTDETLRLSSVTSSTTSKNIDYAFEAYHCRDLLEGYSCSEAAVEDEGYTLEVECSR